MVIGMAHQINIVLEVGQQNLSKKDVATRLRVISIPRILLGLMTGVVWILYGLEIHNQSIWSLNILGIVLNGSFLFVVLNVKRRAKTP